MSSITPDAPISVVQVLEMPDSRELGTDAVFNLSSAKPGNGVEQLRDCNLDTYWQSDGAAPHVVNIHFMEKKTVSHLCIFCDYNLDESYAAKRINIRHGTVIHDLVDVTTVDLNEPVGWVIIPLHDPYSNEEVLRTHLLQLRVLSMHQNGRDTHIRQLKLFGPRVIPTTMGGLSVDAFKTEAMFQYCQLR